MLVTNNLKHIKKVEKIIRTLAILAVSPCNVIESSCGFYHACIPFVECQRVDPFPKKQTHLKITAGTKILKNKKKRKSEKFVDFSIIIVLQAHFFVFGGPITVAQPSEL